MKKVTAILMATALAVMFTTHSFSQTTGTATTKAEPAKTSQQAKSPQGNFVEKDNNGVCDNFEARGKAGQGKNFIDKNGDGKCDNCQGNCKDQGKGNCCGKGPGYGKKGDQGCCGSGQGHQHRHGCQGTNQAPAKPATDTQEKK
jgi:hypothetical protein